MSFETLRRNSYPDLPEGTQNSLEHFIKLVNQNRDTDDQLDSRAELKALVEQHRIVREFARNEINDEAYVAAALGVVYDYAHDGGDDVSERDSQRILRDYLQTVHFDDNPDEDWHKKVYLAGLLGDRTRIANLRQDSMAELGLDQTEDEITPERWLHLTPMARPDVLRTTANQVNIESLLIASAEVLQRLNINYGNNLDTLQDIAFTEQLLEPMAEMVGFDSLAMALSSRAKEVRLINAGRQDLLDQADNELKCINQFDRDGSRRRSVECLVGNTLDEIFGLTNRFEAESSVEGTGMNEAIFGNIYDQSNHSGITDGHDGTVGRFRLKTRGSLAWKLMQEEGASKPGEIQDSDIQPESTPMDLVGVTIICRDEAEQRRTFARIADGVYHSRTADPRIANSKISPLHIIGTEDYIERTMADLAKYSDVDQFAPASVDHNGVNHQLPFMVDADYTKGANGLQLAKVTYTYGDVPIEIQVVTQDERHQMRCGKKAHILYKARSSGNNVNDRDIEQLAQILPEIHARRRRINRANLVGSKFDHDSNQYIMGQSERLATERLIALMDPNRTLSNTMGMVALNS